MIDYQPLKEIVIFAVNTGVRKGEYIFCRNDWKQREEHFIARKFKEYLKSIDLGDGFSFHSFRHTFASHLVQKGVSLYKVSKLLGHANIRTTEIYAHLTPETFHDVVRLLDGKEEGESPFYGVVGE